MQQVKSPKKPLIYYYTIVIIVLLLFNLLAMPWISERQIKEVDYGTFISMTEEGKIGKVEIQQQENTILLQTRTRQQSIRTAMVEDDQLTQRLYDAGISFMGRNPPDLSGFKCAAFLDHSSGNLYSDRTVYVP